MEELLQEMKDEGGLYIQEPRHNEASAAQSATKQHCGDVLLVAGWGTEGDIRTTERWWQEKEEEKKEEEGSRCRRRVRLG